MNPSWLTRALGRSTAGQPALPSIRTRLSRVLVLASLAWSLGVSGAVWFVVHSGIDDLLDNALRESAEVMFGVLTTQRGALSAADEATLPAPPHVEHLVWQIADGQGRVVQRSHQAPLQALGTAGQHGLWTADDQWRVCGLVLGEAGGPVRAGATAPTLFVAQRMDERHGWLLRTSLVAAGAALGVGLLCAVWLSRRTRRELAPLTALSQAVEQFHPLRPGEQLAQAARAELVPMRAAILSLARRLAQHVENERAVAAHAAHALRTPLAGLVVQLASAQRQAPPAIQPALQLARSAADRLTRVVGALLTLFRSGAELRWQSVDLAALLTHLPVAGLSVHPEGLATVQGDPDLLAAALANLLDNAARHGARSLRLRVQIVQGHTHIVLADDGPGVPPPRLAELQAALLAQDYESCMGLGLMLADLVARAHGGRLDLVPVSHGFTVELVLGLPPAEAAVGAG